jgi:uncharacterized protein (DUF1800 family)
MTASAPQPALVAFQRFGLGAKPGGPGRMGASARAALHAEVDKLGIASITNRNLLSYVKACAASQAPFQQTEPIWLEEIAARVDKHMSVEIGFVERLVIFWSNHFSMSVNKNETVRGTLGQWERDVVRRHVLGKFGDMLHGTIQHPAMIAFLDNDNSIGPNSPIGQSWGVGLNENLAREILELHTVGSGSGYTETDVNIFARMLTGWSYVRDWEADKRLNGGSQAIRGQFLYRDDWHEPGAFTLMGTRYAAAGKQQVDTALADLAVHPATAEHIAFKLVRHFITDRPTAAMVDPIKRKFLQTGGDLKAVAHALIDLPASWSTPLCKLRTPYEYTVAQYRALGKRYPNSNPYVLSEPLHALGQMMWECRSPEGYADETPTWLNPDAMRLRVNIGQWLGWALAPYCGLNIPKLADGLFGAGLSSETRGRLVSASNANNALTILFASPEFQRR